MTCFTEVNGPVHGNWGSWSGWEECVEDATRTGGEGACTEVELKDYLEFRARFCDDPAPAFGGLDCGQAMAIEERGDAKIYAVTFVKRTELIFILDYFCL